MKFNQIFANLIYDVWYLTKYTFECHCNMILMKRILSLKHSNVSDHFIYIIFKLLFEIIWILSKSVSKYQLKIIRQI